MSELNAIIEQVDALLFAAGEVLTQHQVAEVLPEVPSEMLDQAWQSLANRDLEIPADAQHTTAMRPYRLVQVAGGLQYETRPEHSAIVRRMLDKQRTAKLSQSALECLAAVAYRQPITKAEVDDIRGVDSGGVLRGLVERGLIRTKGRKAVPGRPLNYVTTDYFLVAFELDSLRDLPALDEIGGTPELTSLSLPLEMERED